MKGEILFNELIKRQLSFKILTHREINIETHEKKKYTLLYIFLQIYIYFILGRVIVLLNRFIYNYIIR